MKKRLLLLAGFLAVSMCASAAAWAEEAPEESVAESLEKLLGEESVADALFGDGGIVTGLLPEEADLDAMIDTVDEQIGLVENQSIEVINGLKEKLQSEDGSFDADALEGYAGDLVAALMGGGADFDFESLDAMLEDYALAQDMMKDYYREMNADSLVPGDAQIVALNIGYDGDVEADEFKFLVAAAQSNFEADDTVLNFVSSVSEPVLFTFQKAGDGSFSITDAKVAEDGEGWADSLKDMCAEVDYPFEDMMMELDIVKISIIDAMGTYLDEHPEYTGIEFEGEYKTAEELHDIWYARLLEYFDEAEPEAVTETATESVEP